MEDIRPNKVADFDARFTNNHINMLKVLMPFLPPSMQRNMAVYIKYMELQYTMQYFRHHPYESNRLGLLSGGCKKESPLDFSVICEELLPYCSPREKQQFTQIRDLFQTMRNMQDMMEMAETMKELFPEGIGTGSEGSFNPEMLAAMSGMLGGGDMDLSQLSQMADLFSGGG